MRIAGIYSFKHGKETTSQHHLQELEEVLQVIEVVDAEQHKLKINKEKMIKDKLLYSPSTLSKAFKAELLERGWVNYKVLAEYSREFYVSGYVPPERTGGESASFRDMDFVKNKLGVEVQFGKFASMVYDVCAKMSVFAKLDVIDCGIEIVPVKGLVEGMTTGVSYFEQFVWDLEHRGVSNIDIPILILGIDTDGIRPKDLKFAERRQPYLLGE